jgi:hypothetical protein
LSFYAIKGAIVNPVKQGVTTAYPKTFFVFLSRLTNGLPISKHFYINVYLLAGKCL